MTDSVVIFGTGDVAQLAWFYLTHDSPFDIVAFSADAEYVESDEFQGLPLIPFEEVEEKLPPSDFKMFVALSYSRLNEVRAKKYREAKAKGYELISYVSSRSVVWPGLDMGDNCFIFENQTIQPFVKIGDDVTLWSGNHVGHHSTIGDHCFITSHVVISGHCVIEPYCFLGVNSTLRDGITIAERSVVGAGATIVKSTEPNGVYTGPAAELRARDAARVSYFTRTRYEDR